MTATDRDRKFQVKALRRLSETEIAGLKIGLDALAAVEAVLIDAHPALKVAAERERRAREFRRAFPVSGPAQEAATAVNRALQQIGLALEDTGEAVETGRVEKRK